MAGSQRITFRRYPGVRGVVSNTRKTPDGKPDVCFYIRYKDHAGKLVEEKVGWASEGINANVAYQIRQERLRQLRLGDEVIPLHKKRKQQLRLSEFFWEKYIPHAEASKKPKSVRREKELFRLWIEPVVGDKPLNKLSPFDVEAVKMRMQDNGRSPRTIQYAVAVLRHVINVAKQWGFFSGENPASGTVKIPDNKRLRYLTPDEAEILLEAVKKKSRQLYEMCLISLHAGLRFGEIANLRWADIDMVNGFITVRDPKNKTVRHVPMTSTLKQMFRAKQWGGPDELVFKSRTGGKITSVPATFSRVVDELGLNKGVRDPRYKVTFHTLRHTYGSWLVQQGVPIYTVQQLMGHKSISMTERYSHLSAEAQKKAVERIERMLDGVGRVLKLGEG